MNKELIYLQGVAKGKDFTNTLKAIKIAKKLHEGQKRKSGEDYIIHPTRVANYLLSLGLYNDNLLAAAMLHDVKEDCEISYAELKETFNKDIIDIIEKLTKTKDLPTNFYYKKILDNPFATLIKISDRCHNVSTMNDVFSIEKMKNYLEETKKFVYPLCKNAKELYPEYSDEIFVMRYHIESICDIINSIVNKEN